MLASCSPGIPHWQCRVAPVEVRVFALLSCVVVMLPVLPVKHVVVKPGVQCDGYTTQQIVQLAVPANMTVTMDTEMIMQGLARYTTAATGS